MGEALQFLKYLRFDFVPLTLIVHQRVTTDTDHLRSLPYSQPGTQLQDPKPLTVRQIVTSFNAQ